MYIYIADKYTYRVIPEMLLSTDYIGTMSIRVNFENVRSVVIITIYRPPVGSLNKFIDTLFDLMSAVEGYSHRQDIVFLGDLNIDMSDLSKCQDKNTLMSFCHACGMDQLISSSTRIGLFKDSILDLLLTKLHTSLVTAPLI